MNKIKNSIGLSQSLAKYQKYVVTLAHSKDGTKPLIAFLDTWHP